MELQKEWGACIFVFFFFLIFTEMNERWWEEKGKKKKKEGGKEKKEKKKISLQCFPTYSDSGFFCQQLFFGDTMEGLEPNCCLWGSGGLRNMFLTFFILGPLSWCAGCVWRGKRAVLMEQRKKGNLYKYIDTDTFILVDSRKDGDVM